jgi:hypothetical protein
MADKLIKTFSFTFGGDPGVFCEECPLPCKLEEMSIDCHRRFFLQGMLHCSYFVGGYCFLIEEPGCVFDNGGRHDGYWLGLLNDYYHNIERKEEDEEFLKSRDEVLRIIKDQVERQNVYLCRYIEEYYNSVMETGGGLSEEMMSALDDAYLSMLRGIIRKPD